MFGPIEIILGGFYRIVKKILSFDYFSLFVTKFERHCWDESANNLEYEIHQIAAARMTSFEIV